MGSVYHDWILRCESETVLKKVSYGSSSVSPAAMVGFTVGFHPNIASCSLISSSSTCLQ